MKKYTIEMEDLRVEDIASIDLVLENCEGVEVYAGEILAVNFDFFSDLIISGEGICRRVKSGYIKISLDDKMNKHRQINFMEFNNRKPKTQDIQARLLGLCDICYIIITYKDYNWTEKIEVPYEEIEDDEDSAIIDLTECPTAKIDEEGNIVILFGELSEWKSGRIFHGEVHHA